MYIDLQGVHLKMYKNYVVLHIIISIAQLLCDHFRMSKSDFMGGEPTKFLSKNGKKQSCLKLPEMARKLIENTV